MLDGLEPPNSGQQLGLFEAPTARPVPVAPMAQARPQLMAKLDELNTRFGRGTVRVASAVPIIPVGVRAPCQEQTQWQSPAFITRLEDLLTVE